MLPPAEPLSSVEVVACVDVIGSAASAGMLESLRTNNITGLPVRIFAGERRYPNALEAISGGTSSASLLVDEKCRFVRPFTATDFLSHAGTPLAFLTEDREYWVDAAHRTDGLAQRGPVMAEILGEPRSLRVSNRGPVLLSQAAVRDLESHMTDLGWTWQALLDEEPSVSVWYAGWLARTNGRGVEIREPAFRTILTPGERFDVALRKVTPADLARSYVGYVIEGDWPTAVPAQRVTSAARALASRAYLRLPTVQRAVSRLGLGQ